MEAAYKTANDILVEIAVCRESERQTILRRNDVERRLQNALETVAKAEKLVTQVGTVFDYLSRFVKLDEHLRKLRVRGFWHYELSRLKKMREDDSEGNT